MADGLKDRELQKYYEELLAMYSSEGWKFFVGDLKSVFDEANTLNGIKSVEDLNFRLGQVDIMRKIVAQPAVLRQAYDDLLDAEDE